MVALGHNSKAIHHAYARKAQVQIPSLEEYEAKAREGMIIQFPKSPASVDDSSEKISTHSTSNRSIVTLHGAEDHL